MGVPPPSAGEHPHRYVTQAARIISPYSTTAQRAVVG